MVAHIRVKMVGRKDHEATKRLTKVTDVDSAVLEVLHEGPDELIDWIAINVLIERK